jgi:hypothetical protein
LPANAQTLGCLFLQPAQYKLSVLLIGQTQKASSFATKYSIPVDIINYFLEL